MKSKDLFAHREHVVISIELHTLDDFLCFLDFLLALCFEPQDFELFGKKMEGK